MDDDFGKRGSYLRGVKIVGNRNDIKAIVEQYRIDEIVLAIPTASASDKREILKLCQQTKCRLKTLPGIFQLANGEVSLQKMRDVDVLDLLGRDTVTVHFDYRMHADNPGRKTEGNERRFDEKRFSPRFLLRILGGD